MPLNTANGVSARSLLHRASGSNLVQRVISSIVLLPFLAVTVWLGGSLVIVVVAVCAVLALHELYQIFRHGGYRPHPVGYLCVLLFVAAAAMERHPGSHATELAFTLGIMMTLAVQVVRKEHGGALLSWALTFGGAAYIGWLLAHAILLRQLDAPLAAGIVPGLRLDPGAAWIYFALVITFASDTSAYTVGRMWGRRHLAPYISPKKSWEGAIGGMLGATVAGAALTPLLGLPVGIALGALLGATGSIAGQLGDLAESLIKRQVNVKDSGNLIPGHGGLLDRADSLLFTIPVIYYLAYWLTL